MKKVAWVFLLVMGEAMAFSPKCPETSLEGLPPFKVWSALGDRGEVQFAAPKVVNGQKIREITLFIPAAESNDKNVPSLVASLAFEIKGELAQGGLSLGGKWGSAQLVAYYGTELCGPKVAANIPM